jgi:hypothetical protein
MSFKIYFYHPLDEKTPTEGRNSLSYIRITNKEYKSHKDLINQTINTFNSQIKWEDMWDIYDAEVRLNQKQILYLLLDSNKPIGHVWYEGNYLYNAFVSKQRCDGDSPWFIQQTMWDMKEHSNISSIKLYTDSWNIRAQKFWKKLGYESLT